MADGDITDTGTYLQLPVDASMGGQKAEKTIPISRVRQLTEPRDFGLGNKTICVVDNGLFPGLAIELSKSFGRVLYYTEWRQAFPRSNQKRIGTGIEGIERIDNFRTIEDIVDCYCFTDLFYSEDQVALAGRGKPVWGARRGEALELDRVGAKKWLKGLGLPVANHRIIKGLASLRLHLQRNENQFVKSDNRGDMETFFSSDYRTIEPRLDELEHALGAVKQDKLFVCEDRIEAKIEVGYDGFCIDGRFPSQTLYGIETKDAGYIGQIVSNAGLPREVAYVNRKLAPLFRSLQYRQFFSSEVRVAADGTPYLIDPTCRCPSPPGELYWHLCKNLAEVIWNGAHGRLVEPEFSHQWGAEIILKSSWAEENWQAVDIPDEIEDHVKLHYHCRIDERDYFIPQAIGIPEIGAVVAGGSSPEEAIEKVVAIAKEVKGYDIQPPNEDALNKAMQSMQDMSRAA